MHTQTLAELVQRMSRSDADAIARALAADISSGRHSYTTDTLHGIVLRAAAQVGASRATSAA